jgi:carbon monoxide dehydrogenase subunit G
MNIESQRVTVAAKNDEVFEFLSSPENIHELLPQDKVSDFKSDEKSCSFKVQGGFTITLVQDELTPHNRIKMISGEKSPFPFELTIHIEDIDAETVGYISFDGEVNSFLKMMVQKPLTNLFNYMSVKLKEKYD